MKEAHVVDRYGTSGAYNNPFEGHCVFSNSDVAMALRTPSKLFFGIRSITSSGLPILRIVFHGRGSRSRFKYVELDCLLGPM